MSRVTRAGSHRNRVVLSPDCLEDRTVPSGNVSAFVLNGVLQINGDDASNQIWVTTGRGAGDVVVTPLGDTTVNGRRGPVQLGGVTSAAHVRLGDGNDFLWVTNSLGVGSLSAEMGDGNDSVTVDHATHGGETHVRLGDGDDTVSFGMGEYPSAAVVDAGAGDDRVFAAGSKFAHLVLIGGGGVNSAGFLEVELDRPASTPGFQNVHTMLMPVANADRGTVRPEGSTTVDVAANDDALGGSLAPDSIQIVGQPLHGTVRVNPDGTVTYTADDSDVASDSFRYTIRNAAGVVSNAAVVTITRTGDPDPDPGTGNGPVPTITTPKNPTNTTPIPFTVQFNRDVTGFTVADLVVTNGTASNFSGSGRTYTFRVTPTAVGTVVVRVSEGAAQDSDGRRSQAATRTVSFDNVAPTVAVTAGPSTAANPIPITVTFSENVTGFIGADVVVTGGTRSNFSGSGRTYTFTVTPSGSGLVTVAIAANVATDGAGNNNTAAPTFTSTATRTDDGMVVVANPPAANAPEWQARPNGLKTWDIQTGTGPAVTSASQLGVFYTGWLLNGTSFDSARTDGSPASFALTGVIQGWQQGLLGMQLGGIRRLYIPAALAYGAAGRPGIPPNSDLIFEVKLVSLA